MWFVASDARYLKDNSPDYFKILKETLSKHNNFFSHIIELVKNRFFAKKFLDFFIKKNWIFAFFYL